MNVRTLKSVLGTVLAVLISIDYLAGSAALLTWRRDAVSFGIVAIFGIILVWRGLQTVKAKEVRCDG